MQPNGAGWFEVDKEGLAKLVERRGKIFILHELLQNTWDCSDVTTVEVELSPIESRPLAHLQVTDDHPDGFSDLRHAYTLFAESEKKGTPTKRGRFNLGEKLVLSLCESAEIVSTKGAVIFDKTGRQASRKRRQHGTEFSAEIRMTREELKEILEEARMILPPANIRTTLNGVQLVPRQTIKTYETLLYTELADENGILRRKYRDTMVSLYNLRQGEKPMLYEMGIPVMSLGDDPYHVDIGQKIPMGMERDAVSGPYLKDVRGSVLDHTHELLSEKQAIGKWASEAIEESTSLEAIRAIVQKRHGEKVVIADPSDREAEDIAKSRGYTVISGGSFTAEAWEKIREAKAALPAGQVTPSPKPYHPDGDPLKMLRSPTTGTIKLKRFAKRLAMELLDVTLTVDFANDRGWGFGGTYGKQSPTRGHLRINYARYKIAIEEWVIDDLLRFLIHELAHHSESNHLAEGFHEACCKLGGQVAKLALKEPTIFQDP